MALTYSHDRQGAAVAKGDGDGFIMLLMSLGFIAATAWVIYGIVWLLCAMFCIGCTYTFSCTM